VKKENLISIAYLGLAKAHHRKKHNNKARHYFTLYQKAPHNTDSPSFKVESLFLSASIAISDKNNPLAQKNIKKAEQVLAHVDKEAMLSWHIQALDLKAKLAVFNEDYQSAYQLQKEARELFNSYQNSEREKIRSKYKIMLDTDQALLKNQLLEQDKKLAHADLENLAQKHKLQTVLIFIISIFVLALIFFMLRQLKTGKILHRLANTDTLTELANRRYTFTHAERMLSLAKQNAQRFAVIIFDIDHFKQVNDSYGHAGGDVALKDISAIANEFVRDNDILGRIGGEEFLLILPKTSVQQATEIAERIRLGITQAEFIITAEVVTISASFGVAELRDNQQNFNAILHEADMALYQAKNNGRNRVVMAKNS